MAQVFTTRKTMAQVLKTRKTMAQVFTTRETIAQVLKTRELEVRLSAAMLRRASYLHLLLPQVHCHLQRMYV